MNRRKVWIAGTLLLFLWAGHVGAATQEYEVVVSFRVGPHSSIFPLGERAVISYTLDPSVVDLVSDPQEGFFQNAVTSMTVLFPNLGIFAVSGSAGTAQTFDNVVDQQSGQWSDQIFFFAGPITSASPLGGQAINSLDVDFGSGFLTPPSEPLVISSDALPLSELPIIKHQVVLFLRTSSGSTQVSFGPADTILADGFESGNTSAWSIAAP